MPVVCAGPGDPEVSAGQASEPHGSGADGLTNLTSPSKISFCIYSPWHLLYNQALKIFGKCDLTLFDIWNLTWLGWNCCLTCGFRWSQHLSSHVDLLIFAWCKIMKSAHHLDFSLNWNLNPGLLRPLRLCVWLLNLDRCSFKSDAFACVCLLLY